MKKDKKIWWILLGAILFVFRLFMGLSKFSSHDELQIYLIGLKSFTTDTYPYYGPDVIYTQSQIPGALQGLLISYPFKWLGIPEAPFIFLNIITFLVLIFFAWYLSKRIPNVPKWFMFIWLLTSPWTLNYTTHIENPSYVIVGSILFFISIFELGRFYKSKLIHDHLSFLFIGFSIFWIMQLHLSWPLMLPYVAWVFWVNRNNIKLLAKGLGFLILGAAISLSTLIPTLLKGFGSGGVEKNVIFNYEHILQVPNIILRFLMFASFEASRYIGYDTQKRIDFLTEHIWVIPIVLFLLLAGFFQVAYFIISFFKKNDLEEWNKVKWFTLGSLVLVSCSFLFSISEPRSHTFFILYPVAIWYSFYCYGNLFKHKIRSIVLVFLGAGILFHLSLFNNRFKDRSLFAKRELISKAIAEKDYTLLALRRESNLMLSNRASVWQQVEQGAYYADFEVKNAYFKAQNIVQNTKYEGNFSCKIDSIQPFSLSYTENLQVLGHPKKVLTSFWAKTKQVEDFVLVYEIKGTGGNTWQSKKIRSSNFPTSKWELIQIELDLPEHTSPDSELLIYFWMSNKSGAILTIDNWKVRFE